VQTSFSKNEMPVMAKYERRVLVAGQPQQQRVQVSQGQVKKVCFFKGGVKSSKKMVRDYGQKRGQN
jgi:hypothetical protein